MGHRVLHCAGSTEACQIAAKLLTENGMVYSPSPGANVTDLLLDVPSFGPDGKLRSGGKIEPLLGALPQTVCIWGGKPDAMIKRYHTFVDLLEDPMYLAANAAITGDCALKIAGPLLKSTWDRSAVLIIGWGRIGKWLAKTLKALGATVTVCARKPADRSLLDAFGYTPATPEALPEMISQFDVAFNTAPAPMLNPEQLTKNKDMIAIDLASQKGLDGPQVIWARGLPGVYAPKASGALIAETIIRLQKEVN